MSAQDDAVMITPEMRKEMAETIDRVMNLEDEKKVIQEHIKEQWDGLKALGMDPNHAKEAIRRIRAAEEGKTEAIEYKFEMGNVYYEYYVENS